MELKAIEHIENRISEVVEGSIAEEMEIEAGDILLSVNEKPIEDIIDYLYLIADDYIEIDIKKKNGEIWTLEIDKEPDEDLGIEFEHPIMDCAKDCDNKCVFCFIDQLPDGMRETLYFKDDDSRLSFLQGNFITLTNISEKSFQRIIDYNISPINVSIHTTNPSLRRRMLGNRNAGNILERLNRLSENRVMMNGQIVLCPSFNDGAELDRTLKELAEVGENLESIAIVPIGLTKHRNGLPLMRGYDMQMSRDVIEQVENWQNYFLKTRGSRFAFLSDEFYVMAGYECPESYSYEGFRQIENGVGLMRKFSDELHDELTKCESVYLEEDRKSMKHHISLITGTSASKFMNGLADDIMRIYPNYRIDVHTIYNDFFGRTITVSGLLTASDTLYQLRGKELGEALLIPESMLKSGEKVFLDDLDIYDMQDALGVPVIPTKVDGQHFLSQVLGMDGSIYA